MEGGAERTRRPQPGGDRLAAAGFTGSLSRPRAAFPPTTGAPLACATPTPQPGSCTPAPQLRLHVSHGARRGAGGAAAQTPPQPRLEGLWGSGVPVPREAKFLGGRAPEGGGGGLRARGTGCSSASHREKGTFTLLGLPREEWGCRAGGVAPSSFQPPKSEATALAAPRAQPVARAPPSAARRALQRPRRGSGRGRAGGRGAGDWGAAERDPAPCAPGTPRRVPTPPWHE